MFRYFETVQISSPEGVLEYKDEFSVKYWDYIFLLGVFAEEGLNMELDLQDRFLGSGARYFVLTKQNSL